MERRKFEESFRDAFRDAEVAPSDSVWTNVELDLEKATGGKMKRRLLFFQLLAAASMVFAMGVGGIYYLNTNQEAVPVLVKQESGSLSQQENQQLLAEGSIPDKTNNSVKEGGHTSVHKPIQWQDENVVVAQVSTNAGLSEQIVASASDSESRISLRKSPLPKLVDFETPVLKMQKSEPDPGMVLLAKLRDEEKKYQQDKPEVNERLWTSVGMGAGTFNPNSTASTSSLSAFGNSSSSNPTSGSSYSVGLSVGGKVAKRIVIQGGVSYLSNNAAYTSSSASGAKASLNEFADIRSEAISATSPYRVSSNLQYMSVPVQAGYIIIDRALAVQLNGGISTDVFFQSTLTPENDNLDKVSQGAGSDSPYRTLNFSGLLGTELSYKVGEHYRIALNPGMRYAFNSMYKAEVAVQNTPVTFDVALRFRYIFK